MIPNYDPDTDWEHLLPCCSTRISAMLPATTGTLASSGNCRAITFLTWPMSDRKGTTFTGRLMRTRPTRSGQAIGGLLQRSYECLWLHSGHGYFHKLVPRSGQFGVLPFNAVAHNALFQPFFQASIGNSIYNSLQAKFTHRLSHGLQLQAAYTWAHAIDDSNDPLAPAAGNRDFPRNSRKLNEERGNSDNDIRHVAVISYHVGTAFWQG